MILLKLSGEEGMFFIFHPDYDLALVTEQNPDGSLRFKSEFTSPDGQFLDSEKLQTMGFELLSLQDLFELGFDYVLNEDQWKRKLGINLLEAALQVYPNVPEAWLGLGFGHRRNGNLAEAIASLEQIFHLPEESLGEGEERQVILTTLYRDLSFCYGKSGDHLKALEYAQKGYELSPKDLGIVVNLADAYYELDDLEKARKYFKEAELLDPTDPQVRSALMAIEAKLLERKKS